MTMPAATTPPPVVTTVTAAPAPMPASQGASNAALSSGMSTNTALSVAGIALSVVGTGLAVYGIYSSAEQYKILKSTHETVTSTHQKVTSIHEKAVSGEDYMPMDNPSTSYRVEIYPEDGRPVYRSYRRTSFDDARNRAINLADRYPAGTSWRLTDSAGRVIDNGLSFGGEDVVDVPSFIIGGVVLVGVGLLIQQLASNSS